MRRRALLQGAAAWPAGTALAQPAQAPLPVRLVAESFPPLQYADAQGQPRGAALDLVAAALAQVAEQLPLEVAPLHLVPLQRALMMTTTQADTIVLSIARTPEREAQLRWLGTVAPYDLWLYRWRTPGAPPLQTIEQLRGRGLRFGVQLRSNFHEWLLRHGIGVAPDNSVIDTVAQNSLNFQKARAGRIDVFAHPSISFAYRAAAQGLRAAEFEPLMRIDELSTPLWAAMGPDSHPRLVAGLTQALAALHQSGRAARLHEQSLRTFHTLHKIETP